MTKNNAIKQAIKNSKKDGQEWFVIEEQHGDFQTASEENMDTFYSGENAIFSTLK